MPIKIEITGDNARQVWDELREFVRVPHPMDAVMHKPFTTGTVLLKGEENAQGTDTLIVQPEPQAEPEPKKRGRAKKETVAAPPPPPPPPAPEPVAEEEPDDVIEDLDDVPSDEDDETTVSDIRAVATQYAQKFGMPAAQTDLAVVMQRYGVQKMSELEGKPQETLKAIFAEFYKMVQAPK